MQALRGGLLALLVCPAAATAEDLIATRFEDGTELAHFDVPDGSGWCVLWNHSVQGFPVSDCYENRDGRMVLMTSHQPDFAAGLGHIPGRGTQVSDGAGGYMILDINEPVPGDAYILRPGLGAVNHRIQVGGDVFSLSAVAPRERVQIALIESIE